MRLNHQVPGTEIAFKGPDETSQKYYEDEHHQKVCEICRLDHFECNYLRYAYVVCALLYLINGMSVQLLIATLKKLGPKVSMKTMACFTLVILS